MSDLSHRFRFKSGEAIAAVKLGKAEHLLTVRPRVDDDAAPVGQAPR